MSAKSGISLHIIFADTYLCIYRLNLKYTNLCTFTGQSHNKQGQ